MGPEGGKAEVPLGQLNPPGGTRSPFFGCAELGGEAGETQPVPDGVPGVVRCWAGERLGPAEAPPGLFGFP